VLTAISLVPTHPMTRPTFARGAPVRVEFGAVRVNAVFAGESMGWPFVLINGFLLWQTTYEAIRART